MLISTLRESMSKRLAALMATRPGLDTLEKVAARSGVSFSTVRRIRNAAENEPGIEKVQAVAKAFGMSLVEFLADHDAVTDEEAAMLAAFRQLSPERQAFYALHMRRELEITRTISAAAVPEDSTLQVRRR